ncbi:MAG: chloride channel protein [Chloroflexi bacterium]|nr:chloride channel protein [Chloroflexota bacterium]
MPRWRDRSVLRRAELAELTRRTRQVLLLAGATGAAVGLVVAAFERITAEVLFHAVARAPLALQAIAPAVGLAAAVVCLRLFGRGASPATSDDYIRAFHDPVGRLPLRVVPARLAAAVATLGSGGPLGYEGPSLYAGAALGAAVQRRTSRLFGPDDTKVLLVAGAAAGVAAIFKAPVTGLVFALEVPYQEDLARRMLLPAGISAAASYLVFAAVAGTQPILPVGGEPPFNLADLAGAAVIGIVCGVLARAFIAIIRRAKELSVRGHPAVRVAVAGVALAATVLVGHVLDDGQLALGPGYDALAWALDPGRSVLAVIALGTLRVAGTAAVVGGGGTGGLFIPLVIQGALVGRAVGGVFEAQTTTLFPVVGMAAFLGAGYRVPLAAVVFVAEFTGRPGFVVPGLIAAIVAQLVMGRASISPYEVAGRVGNPEQRLRLPLSVAVDTEARTVPPDATVEELFWQQLVGTRQQSAAVVDGDRYCGLVCVEDLAGIDRSAWTSTPVRQLMRPDVPVAAPSWPLQDAVRAMEGAGLDRLAVCNDGRFVGVITAAGLVQLDEVLDRTEGTT